ncbi:phosphoinositide 3-kinase regulatory subunit 4 [Petromyzon marinus]|uniref:phosphoinositide 3-kinase regulatory subunit 4 n=1 Tax=Petromyzon marinus TaxID=7757 RepID=UPI003F7143B8
MGNQLAGIAPSQILSVDSYFTDITEYEYDKNLGSTRFFKVARARHREGLAVVKVFAIHDPSLPLRSFQKRVEDQRQRLAVAPNCLPFQRTALTERAGLLFRQYVRDNLYDRISTRPFLNGVEKRWLAFQLLSALQQSCGAGVAHGDIKTENVMVTSWGWLLLTDPAAFKPVYLPEDNPADFNYFFDTSRRRTCYLAPERFVDGGASGAAPELVSGENANTPLVDLAGNNQRQLGELTHAMDVFSAGCVIAELFMEGIPPFDLSQLLAYRKGDFNPQTVLRKIEDDDIRQLVLHMLDRDPTKRRSAKEYLSLQRGCAFPDYFYSYLWKYLSRFAGQPALTADEKILKIQEDLPEILLGLGCEEKRDEEKEGADSGLVIIVSLVTSCLQNLRHCPAKLAALELTGQLARRLSAEVILDRLVPYVLHLAGDTVPRVRAQALRTLNTCLALVHSLPRNDANVFPEYILPGIAHLAQDDATVVRLAYAENIAVLAETALRYLEMVQLGQAVQKEDIAADEPEDLLHVRGSYDTELQGLQEMVQQKVVTLLSDPENIVKQTLLESGITRLCVFFGRQKANDVLLSHMITFLNDKNDWHLRGAFFDSIVGVAAYVGWQSSSILKPLLQQGLSDTEEFVVCKALHALTAMCQLGLLQKPHLYDFLGDTVPFLCHPNLWIRHGAVGFISTVAKRLNVADVHCNLMHLLRAYISQPTIQVEETIVLLSVLKEPLSRPIFDYVLKSRDILGLFDHLEDRQLIRNLRQSMEKPDDPSLAQLLRKLFSQGMTSADEDKLIALRDYMVKVHKARATMVELGPEDDALPRGTISLNARGSGGVKPIPRHADLGRAGPPDADERKGGAKRAVRADTSMNEEWRSMFGALEAPGIAIGKSSQGSAGGAPEASQGAGARSQSAPPAIPVLMSQLQAREVVASSPPKRAAMAQQHHQQHHHQQHHHQHHHQPTAAGPQEGAAGGYQPRHAPCRAELAQLLKQRREQHSQDHALQGLIDRVEWESRPPPPGWRPKGLLVAHLHEHRGAVNRIGVAHDHAYFATCSNDGTVKVWDSQKMEGKSSTTRSKFTYARQGGHIKALAFCQASQSLATASDNGSIHVLNIETSSSASKISLTHSRNLELLQDGCVVDMHHFHAGAQSVLAYATVSGALVGWDLRAPAGAAAWGLRHDLRYGLITSFAVDIRQCWIAVGTSSGTMVCWDMRFQLPITTHTHPTHARIRRLSMHSDHHSWVLAAVQSNNEVSMWNMETGARQHTLWASGAPPLSETQVSSDSVHGLYYSPADGNPFLLTAGSDMRIRYWDLAYPKQSYIIAGAARDSLHPFSVSYQSKIIEGTEVVQEMQSKPKPSTLEDRPRRGPDMPPVGHHDIITDICTFQTSQAFIASASRDGIVKVWK